MPIHYAETAEPCADFQARCAPEEADLLLEWLRRTPQPAADLSACGEVHSALFQLLLAGRVQLVAPPGDQVLAACLNAGGCRPFLLVDGPLNSPLPSLLASPAGRDPDPSL